MNNRLNAFRFIKTFIKNSENCLFRTYSNIFSTTFSTQRKIWYDFILSISSQLNLFSGLNQIGHFNTENITKLTKTKQTTTPIEESEVCSKTHLLHFDKIIDFLERKKDGSRRRW
jgi:hypothetical protein